MSTLTPDWLCFDLDGTLVDSVPDITFSLNQMLASMQLSTVNEQLARTWIGNGATKLIERALTHALQCSPGKSDLDRAKQYFFMAYEKNIAVNTIVFPGCIELLEYLQSKHIPMACVTNKPRKFTPPLLDKLSMSHYFSALVCGDDLPTQKPNPAMLIHAIDQLGGIPEKGFMIGDSQTDMQTAKAAGAGAIYVSYGYNRGVCVEKYRPIRVNSLDELQQML